MGGKTSCKYYNQCGSRENCLACRGGYEKEPLKEFEEFLAAELAKLKAKENK